MPDIDPVIHQPVRLRVMAALSALDPSEQVDFTFLRDHLSLTDGNLGAHLQKLEEAKYIAIHKVFEAKKPKTYVRLTGAGRDAFARHVQALEEILRPSASMGGAE